VGVAVAGPPPPLPPPPPELASLQEFAFAKNAGCSFLRFLLAEKKSFM